MHGFIIRNRNIDFSKSILNPRVYDMSNMDLPLTKIFIKNWTCLCLENVRVTVF